MIFFNSQLFHTKIFHFHILKENGAFTFKKYAKICVNFLKNTHLLLNMQNTVHFGIIGSWVANIYDQRTYIVKNSQQNMHFWVGIHALAIASIIRRRISTYLVSESVPRSAPLVTKLSTKTFLDKKGVKSVTK